MMRLRPWFGMRRLAGAAGLAAVLCGCASVPPAPSWQDKLAATGWSVGAEVSSVPDFMFNGFDTLDDAHFVIHVGTSRRVLVSTSGSCLGLDEALRVRYRHHDSVLARFDTLRAYAPGMPSTSCVVERIHQLVPPRS